MDYEKEYKYALERARKGMPMDEVFPELKESEDERIRKAIESIIRMYGKTQGEWITGYDMDTLVVHLRDAFTYLEKQKDSKVVKFDHDREQKPAEWSEEDELMISACIAFIQDEKFKGYERSYECIDWLKSLRPQPHWKPSEKEIEALSWAINYLTDIEQGCASTLALLKFNLKEML